MGRGFSRDIKPAKRVGLSRLLRPDAFCREAPEVPPGQFSHKPLNGPPCGVPCAQPEKSPKIRSRSGGDFFAG